MIKKILILIILFLVFTSYFTPASIACAGFWDNGEVRNISISPGISFEGVFCIGNENTKIGPGEKTIFTKKATIRGEFIKFSRDEVVLSDNFDVTFSYDKEKVWIENPKENMSEKGRIINGSKWKTTTKEEIFIAPEQCIVSKQFELYKKEGWFNIRKTWKSVGNFHVDIVCDPNGEIKFNIETLNNLPSENFIIENSATDAKILDNDIIRKTKTLDKIYIPNDEKDIISKDNYNYATRRVEISYVAPENKLLASSVIEVNFRYNPKTREVECISTSHRESDIDPKCDIDVYMRSGDRTRNSAGAYGKIKLDYNTKKASDTIDDSIIVACSNKAVMSSSINSD